MYSKKRNFDEFLQDQQMFEERKHEKLNQYKEEEEFQREIQYSFKPQIDSVSAELVAVTRKEDLKVNIHNRLYKDSKKAPLPKPTKK